MNIYQFYKGLAFNWIFIARKYTHVGHEHAYVHTCEHIYIPCSCFFVVFIRVSIMYHILPKFFDRASIEPNFHDLYLKFLDKINSKALSKEIIKASYENCKVNGSLLFYLKKNICIWMYISV